MPSVDTRLGKVAYALHGEGIPIVMLHAALHDRHDFDAIATPLSKRFQVIAVDWPRHGESERLWQQQQKSSSSPDDKATGPLLPTAATLADTLEDLVAALALPPAFFIGNSVGGFAAARLALAQPARVRGLVLVNCGGFADLRAADRWTCRLLGVPAVARTLVPGFLVPRYMQSQTELDEEIAKQVVARARTAEGAAVVASLWRSFPLPEADLRGRAGEMKAPTLLVWGVKDFVCPKAVGEATQRYIPGSKLELVDSGHVVFSSKPDEFLRLVEPFFDGIVQGKD